MASNIFTSTASGHKLYTGWGETFAGVHNQNVPTPAYSDITENGQ